MSHVSNGGRRGLAAAALFAALFVASACGEQSGVVNNLGGAVPGSVKSQSELQGQSAKAQDADARRVARGQDPSPFEPSEPPVRLRRNPDSLP
jgi:hypothetical protein